jgi:succinate dehydrogenase flavin-adding protein (antitoxin of CptAB toxin-antitoxin module)
VRKWVNVFFFKDSQYLEPEPSTQESYILKPEDENKFNWITNEEDVCHSMKVEFLVQVTD